MRGRTLVLHNAEVDTCGRYQCSGRHTEVGSALAIVPHRSERYEGLQGVLLNRGQAVLADAAELTSECQHMQMLESLSQLSDGLS